jgi:protein-tyrosine-phosphatase
MAEGVLRTRLINAGRADIRVSSMGIHGLDHQGASESACMVCTDKGVDLSSHISRGLVAEELKEADLIFVMEQVHKEFLRVFFPQVHDRTFMLGAWPDKESKKTNIKDPIGGTMQEYRKSCESIVNHIDRIFPYIISKFPTAAVRTSEAKG